MLKPFDSSNATGIDLWAGLLLLSPAVIFEPISQKSSAIVILLLARNLYGVCFLITRRIASRILTTGDSSVIGRYELPGLHRPLGFSIGMIFPVFHKCEISSKLNKILKVFVSY